MKPKIAITGAAIAAAFAGRMLEGVVRKFDVPSRLPETPVEREKRLSKRGRYLPHEGVKQQLKAAKRAARMNGG